MNNAYVNVFYDAIKDSQKVTGIELPESIESYLVFLLADKVDKKDFLPEPSFAEVFLTLKPGDVRARDLGDSCLFVSSMFPLYKKKHGLNKRYFCDIGTSSYVITAEAQNSELYSKLAKHFNFLSNFLEHSLSSKSKIQGLLQL